MSKLSFMEKLLDGAGVEWKPLEQVATIKHGKDWKGLEGGSIPVYGSGGIMGYVGKYSYSKPSVLIPRKGSLTNIFYVDSPFWNVDTIFYTEIDESQIFPKFFYHFIKTIDLMALDTGAGRPSLTQAILNKILVPIPCPENPDKSLELQAEIVRILDTFTELTTELTAELTARKKQYNYYRDQLLSFEEGEVKWKALGEIGEILRGTAITEKETTPGEFPVVGNGPTHNYFHDKSNRSGETVVIARSGAYAGLVSYWNRPIFLTDAFSIHPENTLLKTRFLYHVLKRDQSKIHYMGQGAGVPHVRAKDFESYKVPVPPIAEQARIVAILDRFDALTNSISEGLPREIELRQKQYEYYRNLLFSFPKPEAVV